MSHAGDTAPVFGFIGLGRMGGAMCGNLARGAAAPVAVYDIAQDACASAAAAGHAVADHPAALMRTCSIVILSLPGAAEVRSVCLDGAGLCGTVRPGTIIVDCSTVSATLSRELAAAFADRGAAYVDAPVSGTVQSVDAREISILVGAEPDVFDKLEPWLRCMAEHVVHCGSSGSGTVAKLLLNMVIAQSVVALGEALLLGRQAGLEGDRLFEVLQHGCDSFVLRQHGIQSLLPGIFPSGRFPARYMLKDLEYAIELKESAGAALPGMELTRNLLQRAVTAGYGNSYWPVLVNVMNRDADREQQQ